MDFYAINSQFGGYLYMLHYALVNGYDLAMDEDVKDVLVEVYMNEKHLTDEDLEIGLNEFRQISADFEARCA